MIEVKFFAHSIEELNMAAKFMQELAELRRREMEPKIMEEAQMARSGQLSNPLGSFGRRD